jgi:hypothetical protein
MRGQGRIFRPKVGGKESKILWLDYSIDGTRFRESSKTTRPKIALAILRERITGRTNGTLTGQPGRVTLADLKSALRNNYNREGNNSWRRAEQAFKHIEKFFGAEAKAVSITKARVADYQDKRLNAGAARNSVRYEIAILSAAFSVAVEQEILTHKPTFQKPEKGEKRSGFFEDADFAALVVGLPADISSLVRFLRFTGWRKGEGIGLHWAQVDWDDPSTLASMMSPFQALGRLYASENGRPKAATRGSFHSLRQTSSGICYSSDSGSATGSMCSTGAASRSVTSVRYGRKPALPQG